MKTTGDQQLVKRINQSVLLRLIRATPGLSRAQLALRSVLSGLGTAHCVALARQIRCQFRKPVFSL